MIINKDIGTKAWDILIFFEIYIGVYWSHLPEKKKELYFLTYHSFF